MITEIKSELPEIIIAILSSYSDEIAIQYIEEGADAFISKILSEEETLTAITHLFDKGYYYSSDIIKLLTTKSRKKNSVEKLSDREMQIFMLLAKGYGNLEVSNELDLQMSTVSTYKKRIFKKLDIKTIVDLIKVSETMH